jgi:hypothetical protein
MGRTDDSERTLEESGHARAPGNIWTPMTDAFGRHLPCAAYVVFGAKAPDSSGAGLRTGRYEHPRGNDLGT